MRTAHESELLKADDQQDLTSLAKAASFLHSAKEKESKLKKDYWFWNNFAVRIETNLKHFFNYSFCLFSLVYFV